MQRIPVNSIRPNQIFEQPLFLSTGQKLLDSGVPINGELLALMVREQEADLILAADYRELVEAGVIGMFDRRSLKVGQASREQLVSSAGRTVVSAGQTIERHHLDALAAGGQTFKLNRPDAAGSQRNELIALAEAQLKQFERQELGRLALRVAPAGEPWLDWTRTEGDWPDRRELTRLRLADVEQLRGAFANLEAGIATPIATFTEIADRLMERLERRPQRFTQLALLCPRRKDYLPDHAYTVAVLAMAIAGRLGWSRRDVHGIGLAGLLFDLGMLLIEQRIRIGSSQLTEMDRARVQRHTEFSFAVLHPIRDAPGLVKLVALQHHEREDGSGYPYRRQQQEICDLARVVAVADCYSAMTEPRHHRRAQLPYNAMEQTVREAAGRVLWPPAVRALVQSAGLFPVGSYVKLSSGESAHVLAANPEQVDRPLVQLLSRSGQLSRQVVDLAELDRDALAVVRAINPPQQCDSAAA